MADDELTRLRREALARQQRARSAQRAQQGRVIQDVDEGVIVEMPDGSKAFRGEGYSTTDPTEVALIEQGLPVAQAIERARGRKAIQEQPIASRVMTAAQGIPFIGEFAEEAGGALLGPETRDVTRAAQATMQQERPLETAGLQAAGGVIGSLPAAAILPMAGPAAAAGAAPRALGPAQALGQSISNLPLAGRAAATAGIGGAIGAVEGAVSGFGRGVGTAEERAPTAGIGALAGGVFGGAFGLAAPFLEAGFRNVAQAFSRKPVQEIAKHFGVSNETARILLASFRDNDVDAAQAALARAGSSSMLADASDEAKSILDAAITFGTGGKAAEKAVKARNMRASQIARTAFDEILGAPKDIKQIRDSIASSTADVRDRLYKQAYATPINYASPGGRRLENMLRFVSPDILRQANRLISQEPGAGPSRQILFEIAEDGSATMRRLPDVRQWDYIKRAMDDVAYGPPRGKMGKQDTEQRIVGQNVRTIRNLLGELVPSYNQALGVAGDTIEEINASKLGYDLLSRSTSVFDIAEGLRGATQAERNAMRLGVRSYLDRTLGDLRVSASNPSTDIRELTEALSRLRSRNAMDKMRLLLGDAEADRLYSILDEQAAGIELQAAIARNSATAGRLGVKESVEQTVQPGILGELARGRPLKAFERSVQIVTGSSPEAQAARMAGIYDEIAQVLVGQRGQAARDAYNLIKQAQQGRALTEQHSQIIARAVANAMYRGGTEAAQGQTMPASPAQMRQK